MMKAIAAATAAFDQEQIAALENNGQTELDIDGQKVTIEAADVEIISEDIPGWLVTNEGNLTVALEVELTDELRNEGVARELINRIQNLRKESGLEITDHISVVITRLEAIEKSMGDFADYVKEQVLADSIELGDNDGVELDIDEMKLNIKIEKL